MITAGEGAIVVDGLHVRRGKVDVLRKLDLAVPVGAVVGLLGPSGSGKTTLMRCIVGVQTIASGRVTVLGMPAGSPPLRSRVGYMTQQPSVYDDLTVRQNLSYLRAVLGATNDDVERALARTALTPEADRLVSSLSGGQVSRVSLAGALLGSPELLVLDEPTVGLDPVLRAELWGIFRGLAQEGVTLLISSHVMEEATRCDRLLLMREGAIIADATPGELLEQTGTADAEEAFLRVVLEYTDHPGDGHSPKHGRRPR
jgi:ABC-2 type transport system ATP-binding protein